MSVFASVENRSARQALSVAKALNDSVPEIGTNNNYKTQLKEAALWINREHNLSLRGMSVDLAKDYLEQRSETHSQSTLDMSRHALEHMMKDVTKVLEKDSTLIREVGNRISSDLKADLKSRAFTGNQLNAITERMRDRTLLSVQLCHQAGLRVHELYTLAHSSEQPASERAQHKVLENKFLGSQGKVYTVKGKGGLIREVLIPTKLVEKLEEQRLATKHTVTDRGIIYKEVRYDLAGGKQLSSAFSAACKRTLAKHRGPHGLRHTYAQNRMQTLRKHGLQRTESLAIVSRELGHFRKEITEVYLR
jgi:integrase